MGKKVRVLFDTGMVTAVALSSAVAKKLGLTLPAEKSAARVDEIGSVRLGTYEISNVTVIISAKGTALEQHLSEYGAAVGSSFLQKFIVTFDFRAKAIVLEPT